MDFKKCVATTFFLQMARGEGSHIMSEWSFFVTKGGISKP